MAAQRSTSEETAADAALARWLRVEAGIHALQHLSAKQRALLPGLLPDENDLAVLATSMRLERQRGSGPTIFTRDGFALHPQWRSAASRGRVRDLLAALPPAITVADIRQRMRRLQRGVASRGDVERQLI